MSNGNNELPHVQTENDLVEDKEHEKGIKGSHLAIAVFLLIPVLAVIVFAFSATPK
jgi:hypothetical protein